MKTRAFGLFVALAVLSCTTHGYRSDLVLVKVVLAAVPTPPATACVYDPAAPETDFPAYAIGGGGTATVGFVILNQLTNTSSVNGALNTDSTTFNPQNAFVDYEIIPTGGGASTTVARQRIPTTGSPVANTSQAAVLVPLFLPTAVQAALPPDGFVRTTTYIEGKLNDGSTVRTTSHEYLIQVCSGCGGRACF